MRRRILESIPDGVSPNSNENIRRSETLAVNDPRAAKADTHSRKLAFCTAGSNIFHKRVLVIVFVGSYFTTAKWPPYEPKFYEPVKVVKAQHPRYELFSSTGKHSRENMHARRLACYYPRN